MTVLLLRLAAPLQSWGTGSRFSRRNTDRVPSKSGIIGLLAAAEGRRRTESIADLRQLRLGVRIEQAGQIERDFQTAQSVDRSESMPLSYRFYLADAVFLVAIEGEPELLDGLNESLRRPAFPLFLGRRSCPPTGPLVLAIREGTIAEVFRNEPWQATSRVRKARRDSLVTLETVIDCEAGTDGSILVRDDPASFDPRHRKHDWRSVLPDSVAGVTNPDYAHEPMDLLPEDVT
ncbi:type I-E CRISPR-associated protein Cas5/CasD [Prauserella marina]|uniref:CRISPR system Cascade subunit CasD n=1 Tax=Prauserella marina TaxID=530584 RepID=A0A222VN04_9PSEU|nr:type I-E CRISPR-associated protein Cas5/CasD [Prauserella marina]ASR35274.1 type I-E CRISPR-associated protein Cas5/CasD [Prauserella marina]PWV84950.1 CRISPR-associated Cas5e family protein [Prauserella marina]SDC08514.1 CRISPR system Cascade subunit CasD [Prauserella marina]